MRFFKNLLARGIALAVVLAMLCPTAFAAVAFDKVVHVDSDGSLLSHVEKDSDNNDYGSYDYYLDKDANLDQTLIIKDGVDASIDLNGHTISNNQTKDQFGDDGKFDSDKYHQGLDGVIKVEEGGELTLKDKDTEEGKDSQGEGAGSVSGGYG